MASSSTSAMTARVSASNVTESGSGPRTVLRVKRRREESPSRVLLMSYKKSKLNGAHNTEPSGGEEGEEIRSVFHLAGTLDKDSVEDWTEDSLEKTIKEALQGVQDEHSKRPQGQKGLRVVKESYKKRKGSGSTVKVKEETKKISGDNRFRIVSHKRGLGLSNANNMEATESPTESKALFNLLDLVAEDELRNAKVKKNRSVEDRKVGSVTINGVPLVAEATDGESGSGSSCSNDGFVFDLYVGKEVLTTDSIRDQFVSVRPADNDYEFDFHNGSDSEDDELFEQDEDDSNDEDNWRNDYPDSDPDKNEDYMYGGYDNDDDEFVGHFASCNLKENDLSSDEEDEDVYSSEFGENKDGLGGMYRRFRAQLKKEALSGTVVSSPSESEDD